MAQSGYPDTLNQCPLSGIKRTFRPSCSRKDEARRIAANIAKLAELLKG